VSANHSAFREIFSVRAEENQKSKNHPSQSVIFFTIYAILFLGGGNLHHQYEQQQFSWVASRVYSSERVGV
jgi:hypothetical protein